VESVVYWFLVPVVAVMATAELFIWDLEVLPLVVVDLFILALDLEIVELEDS